MKGKPVIYFVPSSRNSDCSDVGHPEDVLPRISVQHKCLESKPCCGLERASTPRVDTRRLERLMVIVIVDGLR